MLLMVQIAALTSIRIVYKLQEFPCRIQNSEFSFYSYGVEHGSSCCLVALAMLIVSCLSLETCTCRHSFCGVKQITVDNTINQSLRKGSLSE